jgi:hypothetical protein
MEEVGFSFAALLSHDFIYVLAVVLVQVTSIVQGSLARNRSIALFDYRKNMTDS